MSSPDTKRRALGRGLDALLPAAPAAPSYGDKSVFACPRREDRPAEGAAAAALRRAEARGARAEHPRARPHRAAGRPARRRRGDKFELIAGERRWRALQRAGLREALVVVKDVSAGGRLRARAHRERPARGPQPHRARRGATTGSCASTATRRRRWPSGSARTGRRSPTSCACSSSRRASARRSSRRS